MLTVAAQEDGKTLLSTLDKFATEFGAQGSFLKAGDFARLMIRFAPSVAAGYLRLAKLDMMQGKSTAAVKTLDKALDAVPITDGEYAAIKEARAEAAHQASICVDFIAKFPCEVIIKVLEHVTFEDRIVCTTVSKKWHKILVSHTPEIWSDVRVDVSEQAISLLDTIVDVLPNTKSLYLNGLTEVHAKTIFSKEVLTSNSFQNIRSLTLRNCRISGNLCLLALNHMRSLKELLIESKDEPLLPLGDILFVCPKLKSLGYIHENNTVWLMTAKDMPSPDVLELESLTIRTNTIDQTDINDVVKRCSSLRNLCLMTTDSEVLKHVEESCPNINVLIVNDYNKLYPEKDYFIRTPNEGDAASGFQHIGLRTLIIGYRETTIVEEYQIMPLIRKNRDTLTTVMLTPGAFGGPTLLPLGSIVASRLSKACFCCFAQNAIQEIAGFLRQCPLLSQVSFVSNDVLKDTDIFDALLSAQNLKELDISSETVNTTGLNTLLDYHARLGKASMLRSISIQNAPGLTNGTAQKLALLGCLKRLTVASCFDMTEVGLANLISILKRSSTVEHLKLGYTGTVSPEHIARVGKIQSLRYLTLGSDYGDFESITDDCITDLLKNARQLKSLTMKRCPYVSEVLWKRYSDIERTLTEIHFE